MTDSPANLSDLLEISREGVEFYAHAAQSVSDAKLRNLFTQVAKSKANLADSLVGEVREAKGGKRSKLLGPVAEFQKTYASLRKSIARPGGSEIDALGQTEERLHSRFQELVMDRDQTFVVRVLAKQYLARVDPLCREIRARKRSLS